MIGLKVVGDLLTGAIRGYESGKKQLFKTHIEPLHDMILAIHKDYIKGFEEAKRHLEDKTTPPGSVVEFLEERRRDYLDQRDMAAALAEALANAERRPVRGDAWETLKAFCEAVSNYFSSGTGLGGYSWYSEFMESVKFKSKLRSSPNVWDAPFISNDARKELLEDAGNILNTRLPGALSRINTYYAMLKVSIL
jgi:hypothetical protein